MRDAFIVINGLWTVTFKTLQKWSFLAICLILAGCSSTPETPEICVGPTCTPAPKKATSRPYQIKGKWYHPQPHFEYEEVGIASYYGGGDVFHGRPTATGEIFDMNGTTAAHKTLPLPCIAEITNLENGRQIQVKVNDRGPFIDGRIIDVSRRVAQLLGFEGKGTSKVHVRTLVPESLALHGLEPSVFLAENKVVPVDMPLPLDIEEPIVLAEMPRLPDEIFEDQDEAPVLFVHSEVPSVQTLPPQVSGIFVDVGEYGNPKEAEMLTKEVDHLLKAPTQTIRARGPNPFAVRVGPFLSMFHANQALDQLLAAGHVMSRIVIH